MNSSCEIKFKLFIVLCRWYSANVLNKKDKKVKLADFNFSRWYDHLISPHNTDPRSKVKIQGFILFDKRLKRWRIERGPFLKGGLGEGSAHVPFLKCSILWDWIIQSDMELVVQAWWQPSSQWERGCLDGRNPLEPLTLLHKIFWVRSFRNFQVRVFRDT